MGNRRAIEPKYIDRGCVRGKEVPGWHLPTHSVPTLVRRRCRSRMVVRWLRSTGWNVKIEKQAGAVFLVGGCNASTEMERAFHKIRGGTEKGSGLEWSGNAQAF